MRWKLLANCLYWAASFVDCAEPGLPVSWLVLHDDLRYFTPATDNGWFLTCIGPDLVLRRHCHWHLAQVGAYVDCIKRGMMSDHLLQERLHYPGLLLVRPD